MIAEASPDARISRTVGKVPSPIVTRGKAEPGSYEGSLGALDFSSAASWLTRVKRLKRWMYVGIATDTHYVGLAVVRLGYAANAFAFAFDKAKKTMVMDEKLILPLPAVEVADTTGPGARAAFAFRGKSITLARVAGRDAFELTTRLPGLHLDAELSAEGAPSAISAVASTEGGLFTTTEKRLLLTTRGDARIAGERVSLDGGLAGYDFTAGFMPRHTHWKWAFLLGKVDGVPFGMNLVEGFVKEAECAAWFDGRMWPLSEGDIRFTQKDGPWDVRTKAGEIDLRFDPGGAHEDNTNLGIVRARFLQPVGLYRGSVRLGRRTLELRDMLGVTEDQSVVW